MYIFQKRMNMNLDETLIENMLYEKANLQIIQLIESKLPNGYNMKVKPFVIKMPKQPNMQKMYKPPKFTMASMTKTKMGRYAIVDRIRNGKLQVNKKVDIMGKGYRLLPTGQVVKMSPREIITRHRAAKRAARKRKFEALQISRNRNLSLIRRRNMIG